jgi:hypothetical protein
LIVKISFELWPRDGSSAGCLSDTAKIKVHLTNYRLLLAAAAIHIVVF